ncbi:ABC transporter permease [Parachryseolinea silvisoli]|uniref:ABC transporter permease n=1 Tax=Parachryseolinea silvisoli TaxID=2873601 RepID=UPI002265A99D|nr:ABC transporter permease [Parachryseolinea silvisoli]MCD9015075.1 ABC transporter permease [Parachryseolinea silvisoli]
MLKNYLTAAWRNFSKRQFYSLINMAGLAVGLACGALIYLYVRYEVSYDRFHQKAKRIYRVNEFFATGGVVSERSASIPFPMADALRLDYDNLVEEVVRLYNFQSPILTVAHEPTDRVFNERNFFFADSTYSRVFDLIMLAGNSSTALNNSHAVMLSASTARRYFGEEAPLGKLLLFQNRESLIVTGVYQDAPYNAHMHPDFIASFSTLKSFYEGDYPQSWHWNPCWTYVLVNDNVQPKVLEAHLPAFVKKHLPESFRDEVSLRLQALTDIHLKSHLEFEIEANGNADDIYILAGIALFVLLIACINFMNLSTAQSVRRAKEVSLRKTIGASRAQLIGQFMIESAMIGILSVAMAVALIVFALPYFNHFTGKKLTFNILDPLLLGGLFITGAMVAWLSSIHPAWILSSFQPAKAMKAGKTLGKGISLREVLVTFQFVISIVLIIVTGVAVKQVNFLRGGSLGFAKDNVVMIPVIRTPIAQHYQTMVEEALRQSSIESVTAVEEIVGAKHQGGSYRFEGMEKSQLFPRLKVRHDFTKTFQIPLLAGRDYILDNRADDTVSVVVNETLVKRFKWTPEEAIGRFCQVGRFRAQIIGVVQDFNFTSKQQPIAPLVLQLNNAPTAFDLSLKYLAVRIKPGTQQQSLAALEALWQKFLPGRPFEYFFLDHTLNNSYASEANLIKVSTAFSLLAVAVACLGLFGLASFHTDQRKREVSIRKVLGSSTGQVVALMLSYYLKLLGAAVLVALPFAWFTMTRWLSGYAYRINLPCGIFLLASLLVTAVAVVAVGYKSYAVSRINPVQSLRSE